MKNQIKQLNKLLDIYEQNNEFLKLDKYEYYYKTEGVTYVDIFYTINDITSVKISLKLNDLSWCSNWCSDTNYHENNIDSKCLCNLCCKIKRIFKKIKKYRIENNKHFEFIYTVILTDIFEIYSKNAWILFENKLLQFNFDLVPDEISEFLETPPKKEKKLLSLKYQTLHKYLEYILNQN